MRTVLVVALGTIVLGAALGSTAFAQATSDAPPPPAARTPQDKILLQQFMNPVGPASAAGSFTHDDIRDLPPPKPDTLKDKVQFQTVITDPRCLPGEDSVFDRLPGRRSRR